MFGRATNRLGIGPHSSFLFSLNENCCRGLKFGYVRLLNFSLVTGYRFSNLHAFRFWWTAFALRNHEMFCNVMYLLSILGMFVACWPCISSVVVIIEPLAVRRKAVVDKLIEKIVEREEYLAFHPHAVVCHHEDLCAWTPTPVCGTVIGNELQW